MGSATVPPELLCLPLNAVPRIDELAAHVLDIVSVGIKGLVLGDTKVRDAAKNVSMLG